MEIYVPSLELSAAQAAEQLAVFGRAMGHLAADFERSWERVNSLLGGTVTHAVLDEVYQQRPAPLIDHSPLEEALDILTRHPRTELPNDLLPALPETPPPSRLAELRHRQEPPMPTTRPTR